MIYDGRFELPAVSNQQDDAGVPDESTRLLCGGFQHLSDVHAAPEEGFR
jgi:hypothetical protein